MSQVSGSTGPSTPVNSVRPEVSNRPCPARFKKHLNSKEGKGNKELTNELIRLRGFTKFQEDLANNVDQLSQQLHESRLKNLREVANKLKEDTWKYPSPSTEVDRLLNL